MRRTHLLGALGAVMLVACAPLETGSWELQMEDPALRGRAHLLEATILGGGCNSDIVLYQTRFDANGVAPAPPDLLAGTYGFEARARDAECVWFARGCVEYTLPGAANVVLTMRASDPRTDDQCDPEADPADNLPQPDPEPVQPPPDPVQPPAPPVTSSCDNPAQDLVACYSFENSVQDSTAFANHATATDDTYVTGVDGNALRLGQGPVAVQDSASLDLESALTIETWVSLDAYSDTSSVLVDNDLQYFLAVNADGALEAGLYANGVLFRFASAAATVPVGQWTHVSITFDGVWVTLYRDGQILGQQVHSEALATGGTQGLHIGSSSPAGTRRVVGLMDELRIWSRALTAQEVCLSANPGNPGACP